MSERIKHTVDNGHLGQKLFNNKLLIKQEKSRTKFDENCFPCYTEVWGLSVRNWFIYTFKILLYYLNNI